MQHSDIIRKFQSFFGPDHGCLDHGHINRQLPKFDKTNSTLIGWIEYDPETGEERFIPNPELDKDKTKSD